MASNGARIKVSREPRRQLNITWATREFTELVQNWEAFDYTSMAVTVQHIKRCVSSHFLSSLFRTAPT